MANLLAWTSFAAIGRQILQDTQQNNFLKQLAGKSISVLVCSNVQQILKGREQTGYTTSKPLRQINTLN